MYTSLPARFTKLLQLQNMNINLLLLFNGTNRPARVSNEPNNDFTHTAGLVISVMGSGKRAGESQRTPSSDHQP